MLIIEKQANHDPATRWMKISVSQKDIMKLLTEFLKVVVFSICIHTSFTKMDNVDESKPALYLQFKKYVGIRCIYPILYSFMSGDLVFTLAFCYFQSNCCNIVKSFSVYWIYPKSFRLANRFVYYTSFYLLPVVPSRFESLFLIFGPFYQIWILNTEVQNNKIQSHRILFLHPVHVQYTNNINYSYRTNSIRKRKNLYWISYSTYTNRQTIPINQNNVRWIIIILMVTERTISNNSTQI